MSRVLIVEDSPTQAQQIQLLLEDADFEAATCAHGLAAVAVIPQFRPDIVVTDLEMPEMNGLQLVEVVRRDFPEVPVILMTAFGSEDIAALALQKGAASYVPKTHLLRDIVATIRSVLAVAQVERYQSRALEFLTQTESHFEFDSDPALASPIIGHIEEVLLRLKFFDATERMRVGVAVQEALFNAMYHGNLEVDSELRQADERAFHDLAETRRQQLPYRCRRVYLAIKVTAEQAVFIIRDDGPGFDPSILPDPADPANLGKVGGRGLLLIRTFMDSTYHNDRGNEITLVKFRDARRR